LDFYAPAEIRTREALRFDYVLEQGFDRSCGFSVAASLLSLYWRVPAREGELIREYARESPDSELFEASFKALASLLSDYGFSVKGVMMTWEQLELALGGYAPIILHYERPDRHFALAIRAKDGWIMTLDPALGCELQSRGQFMRRWSGAALIATSASRRRDDELLAEATRFLGRRLDRLEGRRL
jgi:predicted double-glycine peptidase